MAFMLAWAMWNARNTLIFENILLDLQALMKLAMTLKQNYVAPQLSRGSTDDGQVQ